MIGKVFVFLADGFEEIEGLTVVDMLRRAEIPTVTVSIGNSKMITGAHRIEVEADIMFHEVIEAEGAMYVLPGGMPGTIHLREHEGLGKVLKKAYKNNKYLAAICAAPTVLEQYGMLEGRKATSLVLCSPLPKTTSFPIARLKFWSNRFISEDFPTPV